jgi:hypothetical protein
MPFRERTAEITGVLRLSGRPLQSAGDVAKYFDMPLGRLIWALYRAPDDTRYKHFEIPWRSGGIARSTPRSASSGPCRNACTPS